jgi:hypothetical protein
MCILVIIEVNTPLCLFPVKTDLALSPSQFTSALCSLPQTIPLGIGTLQGTKEQNMHIYIHTHIHKCTRECFLYHTWVSFQMYRRDQNDQAAQVKCISTAAKACNVCLAHCNFKAVVCNRHCTHCAWRDRMVDALEAKRLELDKARGICLVVGALIILKGRQLLVVQRVGRLAAHHNDVTLHTCATHVPMRFTPVC